MHVLLFDDIIKIKKFDLNDIKTDEKSCKDIFVNYIGYVTIKYSKYVNPLYFNKVNGYFVEINKNKYLVLVPINDDKEIIKKI